MVNKIANRTYAERWLKNHSNPDGVVFSIINTQTADEYIGTTTLPIKKRLYQAIAAAKAGRKGKLYDNIREYGKDLFDVRILSEDVAECNSIIAKCNPSLNKKPK